MCRIYNFFPQFLWSSFLTAVTSATQHLKSTMNVIPQNKYIPNPYGRGLWRVETHSSLHRLSRWRFQTRFQTDTIKVFHRGISGAFTICVSQSSYLWLALNSEFVIKISQEQLELVVYWCFIISSRVPLPHSVSWKLPKITWKVRVGRFFTSYILYREVYLPKSILKHHHFLVCDDSVRFSFVFWRAEGRNTKHITRSDTSSCHIE